MTLSETKIRREVSWFNRIFSKESTVTPNLKNADANQVKLSTMGFIHPKGILNRYLYSSHVTQAKEILIARENKSTQHDDPLHKLNLELATNIKNLLEKRIMVLQEQVMNQSRFFPECFRNTDLKKHKISMLKHLNDQYVTLLRPRSYDVIKPSLFHQDKNLRFIPSNLLFDNLDDVERMFDWKWNVIDDVRNLTRGNNTQTGKVLNKIFTLVREYKVARENLENF